MKVTNQQFVEIWQGSLSTEEVSQRAGCTKTEASLRASRLRKRGHALKKFTARYDGVVSVPSPKDARAALLRDDEAKATNG